MRQCTTFKELNITEGRQYPKNTYSIDNDKIVVTMWRSSTGKNEFNPWSDDKLLTIIVDSKITEVEFRIMIKPAIRLKKTETPEEFEDRLNEAILMTEPNVILSSIDYDVAVEILETMKEFDKVVPKKNIYACGTQGVCPAFKDCWNVELIPIKPVVL